MHQNLFDFPSEYFPHGNRSYILQPAPSIFQYKNTKNNFQTRNSILNHFQYVHDKPAIIYQFPVHKTIFKPEIQF